MRIVFSDSNSAILKNRKYLPRFYFPEKLINSRTLDEAKNIIWSDNNNTKKFNPATDAIVENMDFNDAVFENKNSKAEIISHKNNRIELKVFSSGDSFLVFSDTFYPGWKAYIDGAETRIYRTNGIFKGIRISGGEHKVVFNFMPRYFIICSITSSASLLGTIAAIIIIIVRRRKKVLISGS